MIDNWHSEAIGKRVVEALKKNNFDAVYFENKEEATKHVLGFIEKDMKIGIGGSVSLNSLSLPDKAKEKGANVLNHNLPSLTPEEKMDIRRQQLLSDLFLTSSNAITLDGYLVNVDGTGNRVAAMTFGPKKVVVVVGVNKIVKDVHSALQRLQLVASPKNNKRLQIPNPCTETGVCVNCQGKTRICTIYSIMKKKPSATDITVVLIGENLGY